MLNIRRPDAQVAANSVGSASPMVISVSTSSSRDRSSDANTVGVNTAALTCSRSSNVVNASPAYASGGATTRADPEPTADNISPTDTSKVGAATISNRDSTVNPNALPSAAARRPAWLTATPLGAPVDPEVNIT